MAEPNDDLPEIKLDDIVAETGERWSKATLESDFGRVPVQRGWGAARLATVSYLPVPAEIYSSELLDKRTCLRCADIDGTFYLTMSEARRDYPVVQTGILVSASVFIVVNLVVDMLYSVVNPRVRSEH